MSELAKQHKKRRQADPLVGPAGQGVVYLEKRRLGCSAQGNKVILALQTWQLAKMVAEEKSPLRQHRAGDFVLLPMGWKRGLRGYPATKLSVCVWTR